MTGNYRQFVYLLRYQLKRCRYVVFSVIRVQNRFRSTVWRITRKVFELINVSFRFVFCNLK